VKNQNGFEYGIPALSPKQFHPSQRLYVESEHGKSFFTYDPMDINLHVKNRTIVTVFSCDDDGTCTGNVVFYGPAKQAALTIGGACTIDKF